MLKDLPSGVQFYSKGLGLPLARSSEVMAEFDTGGESSAHPLCISERELGQPWVVDMHALPAVMNTNRRAAGAQSSGGRGDAHHRVLALHLLQRGRHGLHHRQVRRAVVLAGLKCFSAT